MKFSPVLALAACAALSSACDDEDPRGRPWDTRLDDDVSISSTSDDDRREACRSLEANLNVRLDFTQVTRLACLPGAMLRAEGSSSTCQQLVDQCVAVNTPPPLLVSARVDQARCVSSLARCDARVGALEACVNVNVSSVVDVLESLSCALVGDAAALDRARSVNGQGTLSTCADLSNACQDFVGEVVVQ